MQMGHESPANNFVAARMREGSIWVGIPLGIISSFDVSLFRNMGLKTDMLIRREIILLCVGADGSTILFIFCDTNEPKWLGCLYILCIGLILIGGNLPTI